MKDTIKILIPFDFSRAAKNTLDYVGGFVENNARAEIILAYVQPSSDVAVNTDMLDKVLTMFNKKRRNPIRWEITTGKVIDGMLTLIRKVSPDLIFMGTSSLTEGRRETRASALALEAQCPVFVIPKDFGGFRLEKIVLLIGTDPIHNKNLLQGLLMVARAFSAMVEVVTVKEGEGTYGYNETDESNEDMIAYYLEKFYSHHTFIDGEELGKTLFRYMKKNKVDLVAILPRNHAREDLRSDGMLTRFLCEHTETPLLVMDL